MQQIKRLFIRVLLVFGLEEQTKLKMKIDCFRNLPQN